MVAQPKRTRTLTPITGTVTAANDHGLKLQVGQEQTWYNLSQFAPEETLAALELVQRGQQVTLGLDKDGWIRSVATTTPPEPTPIRQAAAAPATPPAEAAPAAPPAAPQLTLGVLASDITPKDAQIISMNVLATARAILNSHATAEGTVQLAQQLEQWVWSAPARQRAWLAQLAANEQPF